MKATIHIHKELEKSDWYPSVDVSENDDKIKLEADLPGMKKDDIDVNIDGNVLSIKGERKREEETEEEGYHRAERNYGKFQRTFTLPANVDAKNAKANFKDGVLKLTLPKLEEIEKGKKIAIEGE